MKTFQLALAAAASIAAAAIPAGESQAGPIIALSVSSGSAQLLTFDESSPGTTSSVALSGLLAGDSLVGIDIRPSNNLLYGVAQGASANANIYTIDRTSGVATLSSMLSTGLAGTFFGVDFNPVADRLRIVSDTGQNLRVNVDTMVGNTIVDGTLAYVTGDPNFGVLPQVVAAAYTNSFAGATSTALFDFDQATQSLVQQVPANDGTLTTIVGSQEPIFGQVAFDIQGGTNGAFAIFNGSDFGSLDFNTGALNFIGTVASTGTIIDIAAVAVPEPSSFAVLGLVAAGAAYRRRRKATLAAV